MKRLFALLAVAVSLFAAPAMAANCPSLPYTLTNGTTADATQVMADLNTLLNCANNSLARAGVNNDISQLAGLTTPLSVAQGGTGNTTGAAVTAARLSSGVTLSLTGDVAWTSPSFDGSSNVTAAATLATVNSNTGACGDSTHYAVVTLNAKGLATACTATALPAAELPTQTGNAGKALKTNGTAASWSGYSVNGMYMGTTSGSVLTQQISVGGVTMTRVSNGVYTLNLPSPASLPNGILSVCTVGTSGGSTAVIMENTSVPRTNSSVTYQTRNGSGSSVDPDYINCMVYWQ